MTNWSNVFFGMLVIILVLICLSWFFNFSPTNITFKGLSKNVENLIFDRYILTDITKTEIDKYTLYEGDKTYAFSKCNHACGMNMSSENPEDYFNYGAKDYDFNENDLLVCECRRIR